MKILEKFRMALSLRPEGIIPPKRCLKCGLKATHEAWLTLHKLGEEEVINEIHYYLCRGCFNEANEGYYPN